MKRHLSLLLIAAGCELGGSSREAPEPARTAVSAREDALRRPPALSREQPIATLDRREARMLCEQAGRAIDLCAEAARRGGSPSTCTAELEACRARDPGATTDCRDARFDFPEPCTASVQEYLQCVEKRSEQQPCSFDVVGLSPPPEECRPLLEHCPYLQSEFGSIASIVPRCAPDSPPRVDDDDDIVGLDCGRPRPTRMVALGDSIAACFIPGYTTCAPTVISEYLRERYVPELAYMSAAMAGAITADILRQASFVPGGPGHLLVWIYVGGNDLARCTQPELAPTQACIEDLMAALPGQWRAIFAYFEDRARFPDGVTFMLNTQYSLYDQCTHRLGPERGAFAEATIQRFNRDVIMRSALDRADAVAIDQYPDFLGHAQNANRRDCPHCYRDDNTPWLFDGTHPNRRGGQHIADKWKIAIDRLYGGDCQ